MHIADCPHLTGIVEAIGNKKNIHVAEVHNEPIVSPLDHSDAPELIGQYIPFANFFTVLVFQTRVLADGSGIDLPYAGVRCNEMPYLAFAKALIVESCYPAISRASLYIVVEALASEFNFSHIHIWFYRLSPFPSITPRSYR